IVIPDLKVLSGNAVCLLFDSASLKDLATTTLPDLAAADRRFLVFIANFSSKFHFQREHLTSY
ncbi:MAG: hypothetical protein ACPH7G_10005, partial [Cycloclasticus pugetii]